MWTTISLLWKTNKKVVLYLVVMLSLFLVLWFGWYKVTTTYYNKGVEYQENIYKQEQIQLAEQRKVEQNKKDMTMLQLNSELSDLKGKYSELLLTQSQESARQTEKINEYKKSDAGIKWCLDTNWLRIYQSSLPN